MKVIVIGGTGFIGQYVSRGLQDAGHEVIVFHRGETRADLPDDIRHIRGDRLSLLEFSGQLRRVKPEVVIDMFAYTERDARELMKTFSGCAGRIVAISSQDVYRAFAKLWKIEAGEPEPLPIAEDDPLQTAPYPFRGMARDETDIPYDYDKALVEKTVMNDPALPGTVLRLPMVYGPGDKKHRTHEYLKRMDEGRPAILLDAGKFHWRWTRGYVGDIARAIILAATQPQAKNRIYNVGEKEAFTEAEWVRKIGAAAGWNGRIIPVPPELVPKHLRENFDWSHNLVTDTSRIRRELSYNEGFSTAESLSATIAWERAHPPEDFELD